MNGQQVASYHSGGRFRGCLVPARACICIGHSSAACSSRLLCAACCLLSHLPRTSTRSTARTPVLMPNHSTGLFALSHLCCLLSHARLHAAQHGRLCLCLIIPQDFLHCLTCISLPPPDCFFVLALPYTQGCTFAPLPTSERYCGSASFRLPFATLPMSGVIY